MCASTEMTGSLLRGSWARVSMFSLDPGPLSLFPQRHGAAPGCRVGRIQRLGADRHGSRGPRHSLLSSCWRESRSPAVSVCRCEETLPCALLSEARCIKYDSSLQLSGGGFSAGVNVYNCWLSLLELLESACISPPTAA